MRVLIGTVAAVLAIILSIYILLVMLNLAAGMSISILNEPFIRFIAQLTVLFYLLAAWAFWRI
jgi:hypothetical protein